ncbi:hypothetical protein B0H66DRAFT_318584 [Apodospora peruviana]|uniref:Uncharacterized protein n=1 Tax=Apodospora peruviana TaxID=516989 RepID=A0AAE0M0R2_9PEZI|nr:hypothetical protein B0H66DRAFT_318584 [Apodospora peruviana]
MVISPSSHLPRPNTRHHLPLARPLEIYTQPITNQPGHQTDRSDRNVPEGKTRASTETNLHIPRIEPNLWKCIINKSIMPPPLTHPFLSSILPWIVIFIHTYTAMPLPIKSSAWFVFSPPHFIPSELYDIDGFTSAGVLPDPHLLYLFPFLACLFSFPLYLLCSSSAG